MATIKINGVELQPQPARDTWEAPAVGQKLNGTEEIGAYMVYRMFAPPLAGQTFNWRQFENQVLTSLQTYAPGELTTSADVIYSSGVVSQKIKTYEMPEDQSIVGIELDILVVIDGGY